MTYVPTWRRSPTCDRLFQHPANPGPPAFPRARRCSAPARPASSTSRKCGRSRSARMKSDLSSTNKVAIRFRTDRCVSRRRCKQADFAEEIAFTKRRHDVARYVLHFHFAARDQIQLAADLAFADDHIAGLEHHRLQNQDERGQEYSCPLLRTAELSPAFPG